MPKKKGKKKSKEPEEPPTDFDADDLPTISAKVPAMREELQAKMMARNFAQLEMETLKKFWSMSQTELTRLENIELMRDRDLAQMLDDHRVEVEVYKHKVRHLELENKVDMEAATASGAEEVKGTYDRHREKVEALERGKLALDDEIDERQKDTHDSIAHFENVNKTELEKLRSKFQGQLEAYKKTCEKRKEDLAEHLDLQRRVELHEIEERKNKHIKQIIANHERAFAEMKEYYQNITHDNCKLIDKYEEETRELKKSQLKNADLLAAALKENASLKEPLTAALAQVDELKLSLKNSDKTHQMLQDAKGRVKLRRRRCEKLRMAIAAKEAEMEELEEKREHAYLQFETTIQEVQEKNDRKNAMLFNKLDGYRLELQASDVQMDQVQKALDLDPHAVSGVQAQAATEMRVLEDMAEDLQFRIARGAKIFNELREVYHGKMKDFGIPQEEIDSLDSMGFQPIPAPVKGFGQGPSGLVAAATR